MRQRLVVHFPRFGPYHIARIGSAHAKLDEVDGEVVGLEIADKDATYEWSPETGQQSWTRHTLFTDANYDALTPSQLRNAVVQWLEHTKPTAVAICGYATPEALSALRWCKLNKRLAILMTESRRADARRVFWKELVKSYQVRKFDFAICGGKEHQDYLVKLGMPRSRVYFGYDVVDNQVFYRRPSDALAGIAPYFLANGRFVARKNYAMLIEAFGRVANQRLNSCPPWHLVIVGDGVEREAMKAASVNAGLQCILTAPWDQPSERPAVYLPGFVQINELGKFYSHARAFLHPAESEPWGLVVNEAMASQLPVVAGSNCGAARELIEHQQNGWLLEPGTLDQWAATLLLITRARRERLTQMGQNAYQTISTKCPLSAFGQALSKMLQA